MAINKLKNHLSTLFKLLIPFIFIVSIFINLNYCSQVSELKETISARNNTIIKLDKLIETYIKADGTEVNVYDIENPPKISEAFLRHKIDSLSATGMFQDGKVDFKKGGMYSSTKVNLSLKDAKATFENDSIAEYKSDNWYVGFNKSSSIFNVDYVGNIEQTILYTSQKNWLGLNTKPKLQTFKWTNDSTMRITGSQTIFYPVETKPRAFNMFTETSVRQGLNIGKESATLGQGSLYQGVGFSYQKNRSVFGVSYNKKLIGEDVFPSDEVQLNFKFQLLK